MNVSTFRTLLNNPEISDDEVFSALLLLLSDDMPQLPAPLVEDLSNETEDKRPEVTIRLTALILEQHAHCCCDKVVIAQEAGLDESASYLEIARSLKRKRK